MLNVICACVLTGFVALPSGGGDEPSPLDSNITEVTVYGGSASIQRRAAVPGAGGRFVFAGLPAAMDPSSVRVRYEGGEVVGVETRDRFQPSVPDERVQALRDKVRGLERELAALEDDRETLGLLEEHLVAFLRLEREDEKEGVRQGHVDTEAWEKSFAYLGAKLTEVRTKSREQVWRIEAKRTELGDARNELGRCEGSGGVTLRDVIVDLVATDGRPGALELDYVVANAGWEPAYDLRARKDLSEVELVYRARVWQRSGEDWRDVALLLSTAAPERGTQGPEPAPVWLSLHEPVALDRREAPASPAAGEPEALKGLGYVGDDKDAASLALVERKRFFAEVAQEGLSVRFRVARAETIESRDEPATVLVGRAALEVEPEHVCVPAADANVWLRARAKNTSEWTLLPGTASVFFGADFLGQAALEAVQPGEELLLHLGADPGLAFERIELEGGRERPGLFGSKVTEKQSWRIVLENHGAFTKSEGGSVEVFVQEVLPRPRDDRIAVELALSKPEPSDAARWKKEREEKGVLTWVLEIPKGGKRTIEYTSEIAYPEGRRLVRSN